MNATTTRIGPEPVKKVICENCGEKHIAEYCHEGRFNEGRIYAVVCPVDWLTDYYTAEALVKEES